MSSFFERLPPSTPPAPPAALRLPPWAGPPAGVLGELVRDRLLVYRAPELAVTLEHLRAYPAGFEFRLCVRSRHALAALGVPGLIGIHAVPVVSVPGRQMLLAEQQLRLGLAFADGTRVTNLSPLVGVGLGDTPPKPLLVQVGASGIGARWDQRYWVWGLPPEGPLALVVAWTAHEIPETRVELDAGAIHAAAAAAESLWEEDEGDPSPALFPQTGFSVAFAPDPAPTGRAPSDEEAARGAVEAAFTGMQELRDDEMINVEGGERLGPTLRDLHQRFGGTARTAVHRVERIVFVSDTEAAVWFSVWLGASPYLPTHRGAAVLVDGRWKVSRATFCALLARVGVACPPTG